LRFSTWNVRSLYTSGYLTTAARELVRYKLNLVGAMEVKWDKRGTVKNRGIIFFFNGKRNEIQQLGTGVFVRHGVVSAVKRVEYVSGKMSYIVLRSRCCNIIVLNVHAPSTEKSDDSKDSFYEE